MHLRQIDAITGANIEVNNAEGSIERSGIGHSAQESDTMDVINDRVTRLSSGGGLYEPIGQLLERLDVLKKVIDVLSEVSVDITMHCATLILARYIHSFQSRGKLPQVY